MLLQAHLSEFTRLGLPLNPGFDTIQQHIDPAWITQALEQTGTLSVRHRRLPAQQVVWLILGMALFADRSIAAVMSHLHLYLHPSGRTLDPPPTSGAIVQARDRLGEAPLQTLFELSADKWQQEGHSDHLLGGLRTLAMDGSLLRLPDSFENAEAFGIPKSGRGTGAFPQLRLLTLIDTDSHLALRAQMGPSRDGELTLAEPLFAGLPDNSLLLLDMGLACYKTLCLILQQGGRRDFLVRKKKNVRLQVIRTLGPGDELAILRRPQDLPKTLPEYLVVRAIHYQWPGQGEQTLLTSLLSPKHFPAETLVQHYHERWESEISFDEVKDHMLHSQGAQLRSQRPERVRQEVWGLLVMYNLVRLRMLKLAQDHGISPRRLSFRGAVLLIGNVWHAAWLTPPGTIHGLMAELERNLKLLLLPPRRPRTNRREVKRKMSNYPKKQRRHHLI